MPVVKKSIPLTDKYNSTGTINEFGGDGHRINEGDENTADTMVVAPNLHRNGTSATNPLPDKYTIVPPPRGPIFGVKRTT